MKIIKTYDYVYLEMRSDLKRLRISYITTPESNNSFLDKNYKTLIIEEEDNGITIYHVLKNTAIVVQKDDFLTMNCVIKFNEITTYNKREFKIKCLLGDEYE